MYYLYNSLTQYLESILLMPSLLKMHNDMKDCSNSVGYSGYFAILPIFRARPGLQNVSVGEI